MDSVAKSLRTEAQRLWHYHTITAPAEILLAKTSASFTHGSASTEDEASPLGTIPASSNVTDEIPKTETDSIDTPGSSKEGGMELDLGTSEAYVEEEWEIITAQDVVPDHGKGVESVGVACSSERVLAEGLVRELKVQLGVAAASRALGDYITITSGKRKRKRGAEVVMEQCEGKEQRGGEEVGKEDMDEGEVGKKGEVGKEDMDEEEVGKEDMDVRERGTGREEGEEERPEEEVRKKDIEVAGEGVGFEREALEEDEGAEVPADISETVVVSLGESEAAIGEVKGEDMVVPEDTIEESDGHGEGVVSGEADGCDEGMVISGEAGGCGEGVSREAGGRGEDVVSGEAGGCGKGVVSGEAGGRGEGVVSGEADGYGAPEVTGRLGEGIASVETGGRGDVVASDSPDGHCEVLSPEDREEVVESGNKTESENTVDIFESPLMADEAFASTFVSGEEHATSPLLPPALNHSSSQTSHVSQEARATSPIPPPALNHSSSQTSHVSQEARATSPIPSPALDHSSSQTTHVSQEARATSPIPPPALNHSSSQTSHVSQEARATSPIPSPSLSHTSAQTTLSCEDLLARANEMKELEMLKVELHIAQANLTKERSERQVSEELIKIVQTDLNSLTERNMSEVMSRMQTENQLTDVKSELTHTSKQLKEREERIQELEDVLKGTTLMVRKLEEQNATTLINRGGIDYMLQARLADGRAKEAEQKLQVLQAELLQAQGEVRMLLDRVSESSRDKAEMVSSKVHTQLMAIADEKVMAGERRAQIMEREILELRSRLSHYEKDGHNPLATSRPGQTGYSGLTSSGLTGLSSYGMSGSSLTGGAGLTGFGGGLSGGLGTGLGGLGTGLTGLGGAGLGTGLTGLSGGLSGGLGTGMTGLGSTYSPYSSSLSSPYSQLAPSLQDQYNLHSSSSSSNPLAPSTPTPSLAPSISSLSTSYLGSKDVGVGSGSHDLKLTSHGLKSHDVTSSLNSRVETDLGTNSFALPTFDPLSAKPSSQEHPPPHTTLAGNHGDGPGRQDDDSDSSNWSSSEDEGEGEGAREEHGLVTEMRPSTHSTLIAEWEWRAMNQNTTSNVISTPPSSRKIPPPVAPKPAGLGLHHQVTTEPSSSFEKPSHPAALRQEVQTLRKPRGPVGRRIPARWRQQQYLFT